MMRFGNCYACFFFAFVACQPDAKLNTLVAKDSTIKTTIIQHPTPKLGRRRIKPFKINAPVKLIVVKKQANTLLAYFGDTFKVYQVALGANPIGHKVQRGDNRTPEGTYDVVLKNPNSRGYKALKISYPNLDDIHKAWQAGLDPGGDICIHGLWWDTQDPLTHWQSNWTQGCIALNNQQIDELYQFTSVGTKVKILP